MLALVNLECSKQSLCAGSQAAEPCSFKIAAGWYARQGVLCWLKMNAARAIGGAEHEDSAPYKAPGDKLWGF
jgi:hypothetical protein